MPKKAQKFVLEICEDFESDLEKLFIYFYIQKWCHCTKNSSCLQISSMKFFVK